jgi:hypothetical protein
VQVWQICDGNYFMAAACCDDKLPFLMLGSSFFRGMRFLLLMVRRALQSPLLPLKLLPLRQLQA